MIEDIVQWTQAGLEWIGGLSAITGHAALLYAVPIFALTFVKCPDKIYLVNTWLGRTEKVLSPIRAFVNIAIAASVTYSTATEPTSKNYALCCVAALFISADIIQRFRRDKKQLSLVAVLKTTSVPSPRYLLRTIDGCWGPMQISIPTPFPEVDVSTLDYRHRKFNAQICWIRGIYATTSITKLARLIAKRLGPAELESVALQLAAAWGIAIVATTRSAIRFRNLEVLKDINGSVVYLFTHSSFLDFAIAPLLAALRRQMGSNVLLPSFLVAADHFTKNPIYRWILGIGQVAKRLGMIFVSRCGKKEDAQKVVRSAELYIKSGKDIAIFPQGTRSYGRIDRNGKRMYAGYYAAGDRKRLSAFGKHLKKGAAYLGLELSKQMISANFLPVAIRGAELVCPKGSIKVLPDQVIEIIIGHPINTDEMRGKSLEDWHHRIDKALQMTTGINGYLERCFLEDMRRLLQPYELEELSLSLKPWRKGDDTFHSLIDLIYCIKPEKRLQLLGRVARLLIDNTDPDELNNFRQEVVKLL